MTRQMEALLMIANHPILKPSLLHRINIERETVDWEGVSDGKSGGEKAALSWAWCIWNDRQIPEHKSEDYLASKEQFWRDPFEGFGVMNIDLQIAILKALAYRWNARG